MDQLEILHQCREHLGKPIYFTYKGILEAVGRSKGILQTIGRSKYGKNIEWLQNNLTRLETTEILIKSRDEKYAASFIQCYAKNSLTREYYLTVDKQITKLFDPDDRQMTILSPRLPKDPPCFVKRGTQRLIDR